MNKTLFSVFALGALISAFVAIADTPPPVNVYKMKAPGASAVLVANGGAVTPIGPGCTSGYLLTYNGTTWVCAVPPAGGVTSVGLALPTAIFDVTGSPVTSTGTLTATFDTQAANSFFAGPVSGSPGTPGFRSQVAADVPTITSSKISDFTTAAQAAISGTAPIQVTSGVVSCIAATGSVAGCLSATDWNTFNSKQSALSFSAPLVNTTGTVSCTAASTSVNGCLSSADWNTFNGKQAAGNYITALTGPVTASGPGSAATTITANAITNAMLAQMAQHTFKGNNTGSTANALDLTIAQLTAEINAFVGDSGSGGTKGSVPAPASGDAAAGKYLKADGTWATVPAGGVTTMGAFGSTPNSNGASISGSTLTLQPADGTNPGGVSTTTQTIAGAKTLSGASTFSAAGALSTPAMLVSGAPVTGGSATTTKPLVNIETAGATTNTWNTSGTMQGINAPSGFAGLIQDLKVNGASKVQIDGGSTSKISVLSGSETVAITNDGTTICLDNTTHGGSCFLRFRPNTGYGAVGVGTNTNSWGWAYNGNGTDTTPGTNLVPNGTGSASTFACHNSNGSSGTYCAVIGTTSGSDKLTTGWIYFADNNSAGSETGHPELWNNIVGIKTKILSVLNKGLFVHSGTAPTAGTCGTSPGTPVGDSNVFKITSGTGGISGTCAVTLPTAPPGGGHCTCRDDTNSATTIVDAGISGTTITLTTYSRTTGLAANFAASDVFACQCQYY